MNIFYIKKTQLSEQGQSVVTITRGCNERDNSSGIQPNWPKFAPNMHLALLSTPIENV